jgi:hypothetical protein
MRDEFYLTLVSNTNPEIYPDNTTSAFRTELAQRLSLSGEYECALLEIQLPCTIANVTEPGNIITVKDKNENVVTLTVPVGYYANSRILIDSLNRVLRENQICETDFFALREDGIIEAGPSKKTRGEIISLSETLRRQLGLNDKEIDLNYGKKIYGVWPVDAEIGAPSQVYIYADIVAPRLVGHSLVPLLRTVPVRKGERFATTVTHSIENPIYLRMSTRQISNIEVYINDTQGRSVSFSFGEASLLLHCRKT